MLTDTEWLQLLNDSPIRLKATKMNIPGNKQNLCLSEVKCSSVARGLQ